MPSTDKARINSKASMAQSVSQTTVCSNGEKRMEKYQRLPYFGTLKETGREKDRKTDGEDR